MIKIWTTRQSSFATKQLADEHFEKERYLDFCATALPDIDDLVLEWVSSADFDRMLPRNDHPDLSRARARAVHRPLPRPGRHVGQ